MKPFPRAALILAAIIFVVDQAVKYWITVGLDLDYLSASRVVTSFFNLTFVTNCGVSLGLLGDYTDSAWVRVALTVVTSGIAAAVLVWLFRERNATDRLALGAVFGGAIGNIMDRVIPEDVLGKVTAGPVAYPGCVIDYADLHFGAWRPFLIFNVADAAITIGVLVLLVRALLGRDKRAPTESSHA
ncbi:MAG: signal peptidase [Sphingomonas bacterium]|uniref:signal peptidase II n=1 Tax=Sphingomonas bacterium TaxID=1895847 RepID=UPI0026055128|nr:signal peptidase II [Sphingomonas bacterium]MDB5695101.1 signal peptidase [Sphingomonas bacterium]